MAVAEDPNKTGHQAEWRTTLSGILALVVIVCTVIQVGF